MPFRKGCRNNNLEYIILMLNNFMPNLHSELDTGIKAKMRVTVLRMA